MELQTCKIRSNFDGLKDWFCQTGSHMCFDINPCVSDVPHSSVCPVDVVPGLFPACAVTRAMARRVLEPASDGKNPPVNEVTVPLTEVPMSTHHLSHCKSTVSQRSREMSWKTLQTQYCLLGC